MSDELKKAFESLADAINADPLEAERIKAQAAEKSAATQAIGEALSGKKMGQVIEILAHNLAVAIIGTRKGSKDIPMDELIQLVLEDFAGHMAKHLNALQVFESIPPEIREEFSKAVGAKQ
jgi:anthranilate phosphoribosyltransferase